MLSFVQKSRPFQGVEGVESYRNNENSGILYLLTQLMVENINTLQKQKIVTEILRPRQKAIFRRWFQTKLTNAEQKAYITNQEISPRNTKSDDEQYKEFCY